MVARRTLRVLWAAARFGSSLAIDQLRGTPNILFQLCCAFLVTHLNLSINQCSPTARKAQAG